METPQPPKFTFQQLWKGILGTPLPWPSGGGPCLDGRRQVGVRWAPQTCALPARARHTQGREKVDFSRKRRKNIEQSLKIASWLVIRRQFK